MKPKTEQSDSSEHSGEHLIGKSAHSQHEFWSFDYFIQQRAHVGSLIHSAQKMDDGMLITPQLSAMKSKRGCNCQKSRCIKLYCECYANGVYCNDCNCLDCLNNGRNEVNTLMSQHSRKHAIKTTLEKNPSAFQPKISNTSVEVKAVDAQAFPRHSKVFSAWQGVCMPKKPLSQEVLRMFPSWYSLHRPMQVLCLPQPVCDAPSQLQVRW